METIQLRRTIGEPISQKQSNDFSGVPAHPKYGIDSIARALRRHPTDTPEVALEAERIPFDIYTMKDYDKLGTMQAVCNCYAGEDVTKLVYTRGDKAIIFIDDRRSYCACQ